MESLIAEWRTYLRRHGAIHALDSDEHEGRLRDQIAALRDAGLADDETFLIALRRLGQTDAASREFARERFERLWEQPVSDPVGEEEDERPLPIWERALTLLVPDPAVGDDGRPTLIEFVVVLGLAVAAGLAIKVPEVFGYRLIDGDAVYARNLSLFVLPMLAGYFVWKRGLSRRASLWLVLPFVAAAVFANIFPFERDAHTESLTAIYLPFALWLVVGFAYVGGRWRSVERRTDFVRFTGELFIYYVLIALGGGVFSLLTLGMFEAIDLEIGDFIAEWLLPCGAMGAVLVSAWLVERRQSVMQNIAPMLSRVFTPLFAVMLPIFLAAMVLTGEWTDMDRDMLIGFDIMLALVLGLLLFSSLGARPAGTPRHLRRAAVAPGGGRNRGRPHGALCYRGTHLRVRIHSQQDGGAGRESCPARQPGVVGVALRADSERAGRVLGTRALAGQLPACVRRVGGDRRCGLSAAVRVCVEDHLSQPPLCISPPPEERSLNAEPILLRLDRAHRELPVLDDRTPRL